MQGLFEVCRKVFLASLPILVVGLYCRIFAGLGFGLQFRSDFLASIAPDFQLLVHATIIPDPRAIVKIFFLLAI